MAPESPSASVSRKVQRRWPLVWAATAFVLVVLLALVIVYREQDKPFGFEVEWMSEVVENRSGFLTGLALVFNALGGGVIAIAVLPLGVTIVLLLFRRPWAAALFLISTLVSAGVVDLVKNLVGRPRPDAMLVTSDFGSFPSGHSANAAVMAVAVGVIFGRAWIWAAGAVYTVAMMLSRTYLGAHWISDTIGGMLIGAGVVVIVWAPVALRLHRERHAEHPWPWERLGRSEATDAADPRVVPRSDRRDGGRLRRNR